MKKKIVLLFYALFALLVCSLYLPPAFYSLFTAVLVILSGIALFYGYRLNFRQPLPWLCIGFYLAHLNGLFMGGDFTTTLSGAQSKLSFVLLPFILMVFTPLLTRSFFRKLIAAFFYSSIIICIVILMVSATNLLQDYVRLAGEDRADDLRYFRYFYSSILTHGYIHRSYLGLMLGAALISSPFIMPLHGTKRLFFFLGAGLLLAVLFLLQSRMILVAFVISTVVYFIIKIIQTRSLKWTLYLGTTLTILAIVGYIFSNSPYNRFNQMQVEQFEMSDDSFSGTTIRLAIWENAFDIIKNQPLWGTGYGKVEEVRINTYAKNKFTKGVRRKYNSHNQFLETQVVAGIPGSFFLTALFITLTVISWQRKDLHLFILSLFFLLSMQTEAMLERQLAVGFFCTYLLSMAMGRKVAFKSTKKAR